MCRHTAKKGARYDYTAVADESMHLSAKTTKKGVSKIAPQVVGQSAPKKFCDIVGVQFTTVSELKQSIQAEIAKILPTLVQYTFDCPTVYYNQEKDTIRFITLNAPIDWSRWEFCWTCGWNDWKNSATLKIKCQETEVALLEIQFHSKSRQNMAVRWFYEHFLTVFKENLSIVDI